MSEESPEIPDLKKGAKIRSAEGAPAERKAAQAPQGFSWSKKPELAESSTAPAVGKNPSARFKWLTTTPLGKLTAFSGMVVLGFSLGLGLLMMTALEVDKSKPRAPGLKGLTSNLRVRRHFRDRVRYLAKNPGDLLSIMRLGKSASAKKPKTAEKGGGDADGMGFDPEDLNVDIDIDAEGGGLDETSKGDDSWKTGGAAPPAGANAAGIRAGSKDFPFPKGATIRDPGDKTDLKRRAKVPRLSGKLATLGGATSRSNARLATGPSRGKAPAETRKSSLDFLKGDPAVQGAAGPANGDSDEKASGGGGSRGGGGGGAGGGLDGGDAGPSIQDQINALVLRMNKKYREAAKEEKRAMILAASGNHAQAGYHYKKSEDAKEDAESAKDRITMLSRKLKEQVAEEGGPSGDEGEDPSKYKAEDPDSE
jgi:hypothetical protein